MEFKIYRAKTVHDAVTEALIDMQVTSDAIEYEVIEEGSTGLLGLFSKEAVIRARRKETDDLDAQIHEITNFRSGLKNTGISEPVKKANKTAAKKEEPKAEQVAYGIKESAKAAGTAGKTAVNSAVAAGTAEAAGKPAAKTSGKAENAVKKAENAGAAKASETVKAAAPKSAEPVKTAVKTAGNAQSTDTAQKAAKSQAEPYKNEKIEEMLKVIFQKLEIDADITATIDKDEKTINIEAKGSNTGDIIGKRGQTLDAIQYLVSIIVNKDQNEYYRVKLDTNNYRERRQKTLENLAKNVASKVKKTRKKVALEPMNPYERRVIHSYLQSDKYVTTKSEGEEPNRRVVVYYKKS